MSIALIAGIAVIILIAFIALSQRLGGPRVTTVERTLDHDKKDQEGAGE